MLGFIRKAALSALIGLGAFAAAPAAQADTLYLGIGSGGVRGGIELVDHRGHRGDRWDRRDRWDRHHRRHYGRACTPRRALGKAHAIGFRNPRVANVSHRRIKVRGWRDGYRSSVVFARAPNCPIVR